MPTVDEEGCCLLCGAAACRMSQLRALLAARGLSVVPIGHGYGDATLADWQALERERDDLRRAWAAVVLSEADGDLEAFGDWHQLEALPAAVVALVREHAGKPVGKCDRCGRQAPLREAGTVRTDPSGTSHVCAWGCAK
jgi:hypothetical protein